MRLRTHVPQVLIALLLLVPASALAEFDEADRQCPPGGLVGQQCKDTTNGFTTQGTCTHINTCKANPMPKNGGKAVPQPYKQRPPVGSSDIRTAATSTFFYDSSIPSDLLNSVFTEVAKIESGRDEGTELGGSTEAELFSVADKLYLLAGDEVLVVGEPLRAGDRSGMTEMPFDVSAFTSIASLNPFPQQQEDRKNTVASTPGGRADTFGDTAPTGSGSWETQNIDSALIIYPIVLLALLALATIILLRRRHVPAPVIEVDAAAKARSVSTKDTSVATPEILEPQSHPIWQPKTEEKSDRTP